MLTKPFNDAVSTALQFAAENKPCHPTRDDLTTLIKVCDHTLLNEKDTPATVTDFCERSQTVLGNVAAVCVFPQFITLCKNRLTGHNINIATVTNFPKGNTPLASVVLEIKKSLDLGADEIDLVFPYSLYKNNQEKEALNFIKVCRETCPNHTLKVIIEVSEFENLATLYNLTQQLINSGVDFIKTSTGKSRQGATLETASVLLLAIKSSESSEVGFKVSGGIRTLSDAVRYFTLARTIMGNNFICPKTFRIGTSSLVSDIINHIHNQ